MSLAERATESKYCQRSRSEIGFTSERPTLRSAGNFVRTSFDYSTSDRANRRPAGQWSADQTAWSKSGLSKTQISGVPRVTSNNKLTVTLCMMGSYDKREKLMRPGQPASLNSSRRFINSSGFPKTLELLNRAATKTGRRLRGVINFHGSLVPSKRSPGVSGCVRVCPGVSG
ncbi:hypothetical protein PoB_006868300 [Plakobranchus ocellatus]|uniref:Uncharacterized protein n=1 Tax=Plakobranchus ocellatus TaxID=259542 RepID=A0AAV4DD75_9GAST|nr:hypothetical protein PoB_006868300 [Plakobranchus ocellatus]